MASPLWEEAEVEAMVTSSFTSLRRCATPTSAFLSCGKGYEIAMTPISPPSPFPRSRNGKTSGQTKKNEKVVMASPLWREQR